MGAETESLDRAIEALRRQLGSDRVLAGATAAGEIRQRSLNPDDLAALRYVVRPRNTAECRIAVQTLSEFRPAVVAGLTTFWEPHASDPVVGIDTLALGDPQRVDAPERIGYFAAGVSVRDADRLARAQGLCVPAYPDSDGSQSLGSLAAVACTTGLGMGRHEPVEQIAGLTVVTGDATVVRTGTAWRRGRGGALHGEPDPTGIFLGSQGRWGIVTEVVLKLWPAPFLAARAWDRPWGGADELATGLRRVRLALDQGCVDSVRLETIAAGREEPRATEWFVRCWSADSAPGADQRCAGVVASLDAGQPRRWIEPERARHGELPEYDQRFSVPPGEHRGRTGGDGFLGVEVTVNWGEQLDASLRICVDLFEDLARLGPGHRRLGIYPGPHVVSIGVQVMLTGGEASAGAVREVMAGCVEELDTLGAVPYRPGRLWAPSAERREGGDPAGGMVRRAGFSPWRS